MKKRLLSLALALMLLLGLLPLGVFAGNATLPLNLLYNTETAQPALKTGVPSTGGVFSTAYVRNRPKSGAANGVARELEVVVKLKQFDSQVHVAAIVMRASDFMAWAPNGPTAAGLVLSNYFSITSSKVDGNYYASGKRVLSKAVAGEEQAMHMVIPTADNDKDTAAETCKKMPLAGVNGNNYYDEYILVILGTNSVQEDSQFYIDRFYVDSEGYVLTPSYAVRYNENNPTTGTGSVNANSMPKNNNSSNNRTFVQRAAWNNAALGTGTPGDMRLSDATPTRTGYTFLGWTDKALKPLPEGATVPENGHQVTSDGTTATFYKSSGNYPQPATLHQVYDLYALWQVVPVKFSHQVQSPYTSVTQEDGKWVITWKETPQVGVALKSNSIVYEIPATAGAEPNGDKTFSLEVYQGGKKVSASGNKWNELTVGRVGDNAHWGIAGSPKDHSYDAENNPQEVRMVITVTDPSNGTKDTITVKFPFIEKRSQPIPTLDANTGLQTRVEPVTPDESDTPAEDGQIYGFYSTGPVTSSDYAGTGYLPTTATAANGTYGTGTMTGYYLNLGMVFEYRPVQVGTTKIDWTADPADYKEMPNDGWREVPFPRNWYDKTEQAKLDPTLMKKATTITYSIRAGNNNAGFDTAKETAINGKLSEKFKTDGWLESYGWIAFDNSGLPVIHGLAEDDIYEVRFRANSTSAPSTSRTIPISKGGAVAGTTPEPTAGTGLAINLAGGTVAEKDQTAFEEFRTKAAAMETGDTLKIPDITPERENYRFLGWILNGDTSVVYKYAAPNTGGGGSEPGGEPETPPGGGEVTADESEGGGTTTEPGTEGGGTETPDPGGDEGGDEGDDPPAPSTNTKDTVTLETSPSSLAAYWESTAGGFASIVFYDWDETTVLGSIVVPKGTDATEDVQKFVRSLQSPESKDVDSSKESHWVDDPKYPMTYKKGYSFLTWLPFTSEYLTHCGLGLDGYNTRTTFPAPSEEERQKFSNVQENLIVKACYENNEEMAWAATGSVSSLYYTTEIADYNRVGNSTNYSIDVRVKRENADKGVPRLGQPMLKVTLTTTAGSMVNFYSLENTDDTVFTIYPSTSVTRVQTNVVDFYNVTNKAGAANKSPNMTENQGTGAGMNGFLWKGTVNMIRDAVMYNNLNLLSRPVLQTQGNLQLDNWGVNNVTARDNMRKAWLWKNAVAGTKEEDASEATLKPQSQWEGLTFGEMEYAIQNNGKLPSQIQP